MKNPIKVGDVVQVVFYDHAQDSDALLFEAFGRVGEITKNAYKVYHWRYVNDVDRAADNNTRHNEDFYAIVKKAIVSIKRLR